MKTAVHTAPCCAPPARLKNPTKHSPPRPQPRATRPRSDRPCRKTCRPNAACTGSPQARIYPEISDADQPGCHGHCRGSSPNNRPAIPLRSGWHGPPPPRPWNCPAPRPPDDARPVHPCRQYTCQGVCGPAPVLPAPRWTRRYSRRVRSRTKGRLAWRCSLLIGSYCGRAMGQGQLLVPCLQRLEHQSHRCAVLEPGPIGVGRSRRARLIHRPDPIGGIGHQRQIGLHRRVPF